MSYLGKRPAFFVPHRHTDFEVLIMGTVRNDWTTQTLHEFADQKFDPPQTGVFFEGLTYHEVCSVQIRKIEKK